MHVRNLFQNLPTESDTELVEPLLHRDRARLERIVSHGQATPPGQWYDQPWDEWVIVLKGSAGLKIAGEERPTNLQPGDAFLLPAHLRHRVEWTDPSQPTVWLCIHLAPDAP